MMSLQSRMIGDATMWRLTYVKRLARGWLLKRECLWLDRGGGFA